ALATTFMDEHKTASEVRLLLSDALTGETVHSILRQLLTRRLEKAEQMTVEEPGRAFAAPTHENSEAWLEDWINGLPLHRLAEKVTLLRVDEWSANYFDVLEEKVPTFVAAALRLLERNVERIFAALRLEQLVEEQVHAFPI